VSGREEGVMGNREVPRIEASPEEEGGSRGKHGFPRATEPQAKEAAA
jgi:hypothetical protein